MKIRIVVPKTMRLIFLFSFEAPSIDFRNQRLAFYLPIRQRPFKKGIKATTGFAVTLPLATLQARDRHLGCLPDEWITKLSPRAQRPVPATPGLQLSERQRPVIENLLPTAETLPTADTKMPQQLVEASDQCAKSRL